MGSIKRVFFVFLATVFLLFAAVPVNAEVLKKGDDQKKKIALTFDDGPSKANTEAILSVLREYGIQATFFVIGENAEKDPDRIRRIYDEGHEIGNHTYSHVYISKVSEKTLTEEVQKTEDILTHLMVNQYTAIVLVNPTRN